MAMFSLFIWLLSFFLPSSSSRRLGRVVGNDVRVRVPPRHYIRQERSVPYRSEVLLGGMHQPFALAGCVGGIEGELDGVAPVPPGQAGPRLGQLLVQLDGVLGLGLGQTRKLMHRLGLVAQVGHLLHKVRNGLVEDARVGIVLVLF